LNNQKILRFTFTFIFCFLIIIFCAKNIDFFNILQPVEQLTCSDYPIEIINDPKFEDFNSKLISNEISVFPEIINILCLDKVDQVKVIEKSKLLIITTFDSTKFKNINTVLVLLSLFLLIIFGSRNNSNLKIANLGIVNILFYSYLFSSMNSISDLLEIVLVFYISIFMFYSLINLNIQKINRVKFNDQINVLRAASVLSVIFYHFKIPHFTGGWLGVDIFFVISGYLISNIIISNLNNSSFSFKEFYLRRIRRLLPALFFVITICLIPAYIFLTPQIIEIFLYGIISAIFFFSNFYYLNLDSYTSPEADYYPLLHTWSLSTEEQFYLVLPVILYLLKKYFKKNFVFFIKIIFLLSLFINFFPFSSKELFYLPYVRFWEFLFGTMIMLIGFNYKSINSKIIYAFSLILGIYFLTFTSENEIAEFLPRLAILSCVAIILLNDTRTNLLTRFNNFKIVKLIGLSSYSSYLLHQPVYSFYLTIKDRTFTQYILIEKVLLILLIFCISYFIWRYVELYFLNLENKKILFSFLSLIFCIVILFSLVGLNSNNFSNRYEELPLKVTNLITDEGKKLLRDENGNICDGFNNYCEFQNSNVKKMIVIGDSQSILFSSFLYDEYKDKFNFIPLNGDRLFRCVFYKIDLVGDCEGNEEILFQEFLNKNTNSVYIFIASFERFEEGWTKAGQNFSYYFDEIISSDNDLIVVAPVPYSFKNIDIKLLYENRNFIFGDSIGYDFEEWHPKISQIKKFLNDQDVSLLIDPTEAFCDNIIPNTCVSASDEKIYYYDRVHLSLDGQKVLTDYFLKIVNENVNLLNHYK